MSKEKLTEEELTELEKEIDEVIGYIDNAIIGIEGVLDQLVSTRSRFEQARNEVSNLPFEDTRDKDLKEVENSIPELKDAGFTVDSCAYAQVEYRVWKVLSPEGEEKFIATVRTLHARPQWNLYTTRVGKVLNGEFNFIDHVYDSPDELIEDIKLELRK